MILRPLNPTSSAGGLHVPFPGRQQAPQAVGVAGVPEIAVEEALWLVADAMLAAPAR